MERVYGVPIGEVETLRAANVDFQVLAHKGVETFFTQVFEHNFFHADMHPGNIQVDITDPTNPSYIAWTAQSLDRWIAKTSTTLRRTSRHSSTGTIARL